MPCWTDKPAYEPAPPVADNPWYSDVPVCACHGVARRFAAGNWRCAIKYRALQQRYQQSEKRRASWRRYDRTPARRAAHNAAARRRVRVGGRDVYLKTDAQCKAARELARTLKAEFNHRYKTHAEQRQPSGTQAESDSPR